MHCASATMQLVSIISVPWVFNFVKDFHQIPVSYQSVFLVYYVHFHICFHLSTDTFSIPCHCEVKLAQRSHWHCPKCQSIIQRKHSFENHLKKHGEITQKHRKKQILYSLPSAFSTNTVIYTDWCM